MSPSNESVEIDKSYELITRNCMLKTLDLFLALESIWTDLGEKEWTEDNFLLDLPLKWNLSFMCKNRSDESIIGYIIASQKPGTQNGAISNVNKIIVDNAYRGNGVGKHLMELYTQACLEQGLKKSQLKALVDNKDANTFYKKLGYNIIDTVKGTDDLTRYLYEKRLR
ncbi:GNAT family N-acetyltransferase [archaeon]|nr:GNAT family N-acetyltransferase [archaeon]